MSYLKIKLDIEDELFVLEELLSPYIQEMKDMTGYMFLPCLRFPVYNSSLERTPNDRRELIKKNKILNQYNIEYVIKNLSYNSYLPWKTIEPIMRYVSSNIYEEYRYSNEYRENLLIKGGANFLMYCNHTLEDILEEYDINGYPDVVLEKTYDLTNDIIAKVRAYTDNHRNIVIDFDYTTNVVYLVDKGQIKSYRYDEYFDLKEANG